MATIYVDSKYDQQLMDVPARKLYSGTVMPVHYYDCMCDMCQVERHYPCGSTECDYCSMIGSLINQSNYGMDDLITYGQYLDMGGADGDYFYNSSDYVLKTCDAMGCYRSLTAQEYKHMHGYCTRHEDLYYEDDDQTYEDDYDQDEDEDRYSDRYSTFRHGHTIGEVLEPNEYWHTTEAWIAPNGDLHFVPLYTSHGIGHYETACELGYSGTSDAERHGYIHISTYYDSRNPFHYVPDDIAEDQFYTTQLMCDSHGWDYPRFLQDYLDAQKEEPQEEITITPMQNLSYSWLTMKRSERDIWYPLSGD